MRKLVRTGRIAAIFVVLSIIILIFVAKMYQLQILEGTDSENLKNTITANEPIPATRGSILDRNGELLISTEVTNYITLSRSTLLQLDDMNEILLEIASIAKEFNIDYTDTFPITRTAPFEYVENPTSFQSYALSKYFEFFGIDDSITASDFFVWIKNHYGIDYTVPIEDARTMIGIRYELELRVIIGTDEYVFTDNASTDFISALEERGIPGVIVGITSSRVYHTKYAAHVLGYVGKMDENEYEMYKSQGYAMDEDIGKDGLEKAFESYLHAEDGILRVTRSADTRAIVNTEIIKEADPGKNVYTSIDIGVQKATENALERTIDSLNATRIDGAHVNGAAVAVIDVKNSSAMALASYPTFDITSFFDNYTELINDSTNPLFNRATNGTYNPGSTFKMVTGFAGLCAGVITRYSTINDVGIYSRYSSSGFSPRCWIYSTTGGGHGPLDIVNALRYSCNYFFYTIGDTIGADAMAEAARKFGFGSSTGIEIGDSEGIVATPEYKMEVVGDKWYAADNVIGAIGQGYNMFTPLQLANYAATIANGGIRNKVTIIDRIKSADYNKTISKHSPEKAYEFSDDEKEYIAILQEGMEAVSSPGGSAYSVFGNYPVKVACKTGTVQSDTSANNGVFICYAPADDPEIAVAVVVEQGYAGATIITVAKDILDYYFGDRYNTINIIAENSLVN